MKENSCVIVIPVHSPDPSPYELISFQQCFKILGHHPIKVLAPRNIGLENYNKVVPHFETVFIHPKWQASLNSYNKLKKSRFFYNLFTDYDFLLTCELDAFVFKDEVAYWCNKGYDYIGAPWFEGYHTPVSNKLVGVGNSGFSLRRIKPIQKILKSMYCRDPLDKDNSIKHLIKVYLKKPVRWLLSQGGENYIVLEDYNGDEDRFFSLSVPLVYEDFIVAPIEEATKFSFELKPEVLFIINNQQLPMGCHAWWRYNLPFWKPFIEDFGYQL